MTEAADWTLPYPASDSGSDADTILMVARISRVTGWTTCSWATTERICS